MNTLWWTNILPWKITIFHGKIHYFYGKSPCLMGKSTISMENHNFSWENPLFQWPFSIVFCMFTRPGISHTVAGWSCPRPGPHPACCGAKNRCCARGSARRYSCDSTSKWRWRIWRRHRWMFWRWIFWGEPWTGWWLSMFWGAETTFGELICCSFSKKNKTITYNLGMVFNQTTVCFVGGLFIMTSSPSHQLGSTVGNATPPWIGNAERTGPPFTLIGFDFFSICRTSKRNLIAKKNGQEDDNHVVYHQNGFHVCFLSHKGHSLFGNISLHEKFCFQNDSLEKPNMPFGNINHSRFGNIHFLEFFGVP